MDDLKVEISMKLVNGILGYLGTRPYQDVFPLIQQLQAEVLPQLPAPEVVEPPTKQ